MELHLSHSPTFAARTRTCAHAHSNMHAQTCTLKHASAPPHSVRGHARRKELPFSLFSISSQTLYHSSLFSHLFLKFNTPEYTFVYSKRQQMLKLCISDKHIFLKYILYKCMHFIAKDLLCTIHIQLQCVSNPRLPPFDGIVGCVWRW